MTTPGQRRVGLAQGNAARLVFNQSALTHLLSGIDGPVAKDILRRTVRVERAAKRFCPVDTGRLRASISHRLEQDAKGVYGVVGTNVTYAPFVEFGSGGRRESGPIDEFEGGGANAQPFLRPALFASRGGRVTPNFKALG